MEVLRVDLLKKSYRLPKLRAKKKPALLGLSLEAREGEVLGLVGPNGAGKTTFFRILMGLLRPDEGSGHILGFPLGHPEARRQMGFLPERFFFYPRLTVEEMLNVSARLSGASKKEMRFRTQSAMKRLGLDEVFSVQLGSLSKGWLQRVGLAQALVGEPRLLILDEPMSGLDPLGRAQVREFISELAAEGRTILLSSHILPDVEALAHRVALISKGQILEITSMSQILRESQDDMEIQLLPPEGYRPGKGRMSGRDTDGWERWVLEGLQQGELEMILSDLLKKGASIRSIQPRTNNLESRLLEQMKIQKKRVA
ncbi:MAG: ABC transporter ATP-binding protein [Candidatus Eisenbacteria bacterium]|uniref:ABC transporter ATP-binding protein n=1 Tax=Eiseniibacteriota bacterium TaxID=2212470 RepID=A0A948RXM8_UNCEI|nr:ABC transporter ATP-binding protein [Candidatus Eisenbacteria bacterium]MBU1948011.1 ABC transporter ATP-binding protein [Candidatus Eisenbacteria bacterium]MBU2691442.1 ABC transporter ATP-binding protein [Candidatus Eisenbacteria bacterium]